ncbi:GCN5-related protein N-acetyltransferase [Beutenbergia cavernae DSM 12333]|uniref:GCN5-related protein N-acetyltransferase n=1 Tax=Beutenbergia cavernae (strain ATCC BAA-8 / DSM 12333 / CCUG 43141 / JCM 11478 / NBRC 16432 / NCIMB 13614 / HKI 0122) TaxID=471853 RepID=C5C3Z6_BEUC1|nr:GNAT family N-acetyltransferase [Beutenbergia cavernae]ACQ79909.1 GCN5-related protein N-acetyltransferase [Beutenbergia cavernae DSM 12333]
MAGSTGARGGGDGMLTTSSPAFEDVAAVMGTRGDASRCWCQFFRLTNAAMRPLAVDDLRERMRTDLATDGPSPGVVATLDGEPVGWCAVAPWSAYPRLWTSPSALGADVERGSSQRDGVWSVTCFVVRPGHRRRGLARTLLRAAVEHARSHGAHTVEAYPVDPGTRRVSSNELYHGTVSLFEGAGFTVVSSPRPGRAVVRLALADGAAR